MSDSLQSTGYLNKRIPLTHIFIESDQKNLTIWEDFAFRLCGWVVDGVSVGEDSVKSSWLKEAYNTRQGLKRL